MSKLITLSNLGYFLNKLNLSNSISRLIQNIPTSPKGNIYLDTTNQLLKYKKGGEWHEITLYEEKPTENTLALRIGNKTYYAGLVDPTDEEASDLRIRLNNVVYAVAYEKAAGAKSVPSGSYVKSSTGIPLWGSSSVEIYAKIQATHISTQPTNWRPILRIFQHGTTANARKNTTTQASIHEATNAYIEVCFDSARIAHFTCSTSFNGPISQTTLYQYNGEGSRVNSATANAEHEYLLTYTPGGNTDFFYDGTSKFSWNGYNSGGEKSVDVAIGDVLGDSNFSTAINEFYVKVNGIQTLGLSDLK